MCFIMAKIRQSGIPFSQSVLSFFFKIVIFYVEITVVQCFSTFFASRHPLSTISLSSGTPGSKKDLKISKSDNWRYPCLDFMASGSRNTAIVDIVSQPG